MNRFWNAVVRPLFDIVQPKHVVEIGAATGLNTRNLLQYCKDNKEIGVRLTSVDPAPSFDIDSFKEEYGVDFNMDYRLSIDALPDIADADIILIDGDHNWFTVFNELKIIEKTHRESYPIIVFHDTGFPYGRRDVYYTPENIPEQYRQPHYKKAITPYQSTLQEVGINPHINNADHEFGKKNGVLTAIEDFIDESILSFSFIQVFGNNGLGIMALHSSLEGNPKLKEFMDGISVSEMLTDYYLDYERQFHQEHCNALSYAIESAYWQSATQNVSEEKNNLVSEIDSLIKRNKELEDKCAELENNNTLTKAELKRILASRTYRLGNSVRKAYRFFVHSNTE